MPNHVHLLIEMQDDPVSRIMQCVLTSYSQYHNRKYKKIGHLFQGRYKSILCQTDRYLGELVRYIHLNPVRASMVKRPEDYNTGVIEHILVLTKQRWWMPSRVRKERGITNREVAEALGIGPAAVTRRAKAARSRNAASIEEIALRETLGSNLRP